MGARQSLIPAHRIEHAILLLRGEKVILDAHLAALYGVQTKVLIQAVKRNLERFPADFMLRLTKAEFADLRSQSVTSSAWGGRRYPPYAFFSSRPSSRPCENSWSRPRRRSASRSGSEVALGLARKKEGRAARRFERRPEGRRGLDQRKNLAMPNHERPILAYPASTGGPAKARSSGCTARPSCARRWRMFLMNSRSPVWNAEVRPAA